MKRFLYLLLAFFLVVGTSSLQSCSRKSGCPAYETTKVKTKRNGNLSKRKGKSELFPKKMRRKGKQRLRKIWSEKHKLDFAESIPAEQSSQIQNIPKMISFRSTI